MNIFSSVAMTATALLALNAQAETTHLLGSIPENLTIQHKPVGRVETKGMWEIKEIYHWDTNVFALGSSRTGTFDQLFEWSGYSVIEPSAGGLISRRDYLKKIIWTTEGKGNIYLSGSARVTIRLEDYLISHIKYERNGNLHYVLISSNQPSIISQIYFPEDVGPKFSDKEGGPVERILKNIRSNTGQFLIELYENSTQLVVGKSVFGSKNLDARIERVRDELIPAAKLADSDQIVVREWKEMLETLKKHRSNINYENNVLLRGIKVLDGREYLEYEGTYRISGSGGQFDLQWKSVSFSIDPDTAIVRRFSEFGEGNFKLRNGRVEFTFRQTANVVTD